MSVIVLTQLEVQEDEYIKQGIHLLGRQGERAPSS